MLDFTVEVFNLSSPLRAAFNSAIKENVKVTQSCPTFGDPMDYTVHGMLQARILEHTAFPFSKGSSQSRDGTQVSLIAGKFFTSWATGKPKNTGVFSSSVFLFSSCLQSFSASESFQMSQIFASGGQSIGVSASASVLPMNIQDWFPLEWTGWISLQSKGLSRVFSNTTVQKH